MPTNKDGNVNTKTGHDPRILAVIADILGVTPADIDLEADLQEGLNLTPNDLEDLFHQVQEQFNIVFEPGETRGIESMSELIELIEDKELES